MIINTQTFEATSEPKNEIYGTVTKGTVECTLGRETRRVECTKVDDEISVYGAFSGKYRTGTTAWPAKVSVDHRGEHVWFGRDDRSGRFNKANCLFWRKDAK